MASSIPLPDLISYKFYEVSKFISLDGHTTDFFLIAINPCGLWQGLSKEEQAMMAQALKTAMDWQWRGTAGRDRPASLVKLKTLMQVNELTPADKALFVEATRPVYAQFEASVGKDFLDFTRQQLGSASEVATGGGCWRGGARALPRHDRAGICRRWTRSWPMTWCIYTPRPWRRTRRVISPARGDGL